MKEYCYILKDGKNYSGYEMREDILLSDIAKEMGKQDVICALMNGKVVSLVKPPEPNAKIRFLAPKTNEQASRVFLRGATFVLYAAAKALFPDKKLVVNHMLCGGIYCELGDITQEQIGELEEKVQQYTGEDEDFVLTVMHIDKAKTIIHDQGLVEKTKLLSFRPFDYFNLYEYKGFSNYFHGTMPKSAGYVKETRLFAYADGFILKYPAPYSQAHTDIINQPKYASVFEQAEQWAKVLNATYVSDINTMYQNDEITDFINVNEALHEKRIAAIARVIADKTSVRVVLIAGPSSSGKTTFAKRLSIHLRVLGKKCSPISLDDYYKDHAIIPRDENGDFDFECLDALDVAKLNEDLGLLLDGKVAELPQYDFITGKRREQTIPTRIDDNILILEGIHGLNDSLTQTVGPEKKFKIFISPLTTLNLDNHNVVVPEDLRLLRRLARDKRTRGSSFEQTFDLWDSVRRGEYNYILPYQETADMMFNSTLLYEPLVLKKYCYNELRRFTPEMKNYPLASSLLKFLNYFLSIIDERAIPQNSILREFIGNNY